MRDIYVAATIAYDGDQRSKNSPRVSSYCLATTCGACLSLFLLHESVFEHPTKIRIVEARAPQNL